MTQLLPPGDRNPLRLVRDNADVERIRTSVMERVELMVTAVLDTVLIALMIVARGLLLRLFNWMLPVGSPGTILLKVLEVVLDIALVAAALAITGFDLAKRVRNAYEEFKSA